MASLDAIALQRTGLALLAALAVASCTAGPDYKKPTAAQSPAFKELKDWKPAHPVDMVDRGAWWSIYEDASLDALERQVNINNQNLRAAEAGYRTALALVAQARAGYFPTVSAGPSASNRQTYASSTSNVVSNGVSIPGGGNTNNSTYQFAANASWTPDFWGQVRRQVESNVAEAQASAAQVAVARLSAQAQLAQAYFQLRFNDSLRKLLSETVEAYRRSLEITQNQYNVGVATRGDVVTAQTQLETTAAQAIAVGVQRGQLEHAIATLIGKPPSEVTIAPDLLNSTVPVVPAGLPSTLLERRPDIAQAERTMQQQNALIGVQSAAYFPTITLTGSLTYLGSSLAELESAATQVWNVAASGSEVLFNGGVREAAVAAATATYEQSVANYRQTVLAALQGVEDALVSLRVLEQQAQVQSTALGLARQAVQIALNQYRAGTQPYTTVVTAQATALANEQTALQIQQNRLVASVALIQNLGGGWNTSLLPTPDEVKHPKAKTVSAQAPARAAEPAKVARP